MESWGCLQEPSDHQEPYLWWFKAYLFKDPMHSTAINLPFGDGLHHPMSLPHYIMLYSILTWDADPSVTKTILECTMLIRKKTWVVWGIFGPSAPQTTWRRSHAQMASVWPNLEIWLLWLNMTGGIVMNIFPVETVLKWKDGFLTPHKIHILLTFNCWCSSGLGLQTKLIWEDPWHYFSWNRGVHA